MAFFSTSDVAQNSAITDNNQRKDFEPLPEGVYDCVVNEIKYQDNAKGTGAYVKVEFGVTTQGYLNRRLWSYFNIKHDNEKVANIGKHQFADFLKALAVESVESESDLGSLVGNDLCVVVKIESDSRDGKPTNRCVGYRKAQLETPKFFSKDSSGATKIDESTIPF